MTYKEMLAQIDPESVDDDNIGGCSGCPEDYGRGWRNLQGDECHCNDDTCRRCWSQEIPGTEPTEAQTSIKDSGERTTFATGAWRSRRSTKVKTGAVSWPADLSSPAS